MLNTSAQVSVVFDPIRNPRSLQTMLQVDLMNTQSATSATILLEVKTTAGAVVVQLTSAGFPLRNGMNSLRLSPPAIAKLQFGESNLAKGLRASGALAPGSYEFCYTIFEDLKRNTPNVLGSDCFTTDLTPLGTVELVYPAHKDSLCASATTLQWLPLVPAPAGVQYMLHLTELRPDQTATEAIMSNAPIVQARGLHQTVYALQSQSSLLKPGYEYAWQVIASVQDQVMDRSEIWTFRYACPVDAPLPKGDAYRSIDNMQFGNYLRVNEILRFSVNNPYGKLPVKYTVRNLADFSDQIKQLPKLVLQPGNNHIDIDLSDTRGMQHGKSYELILYLPGQNPKKLLFVYE